MFKGRGVALLSICIAITSSIGLRRGVGSKKVLRGS